MKSLPEYITEHLGKPFAWGFNDCVTFSFGWASIAAGRDVLNWPYDWASEREALRRIREHGGELGLEAVIDARLRRIDPRLACDGDLALRERTVYVFSGADIVSVGIDGLVFVPRKEASCAWSY